MTDDEGWVYTLRFNEFAHELVEESGVGLGLAAVNVVLRDVSQALLTAQRSQIEQKHPGPFNTPFTHLLTQFAQELVGIIIMKRLSWRESDVQLLLQLANHIVPLPRRLEINRVLLLPFTLSLRVESQLGGSVKVLNQTRNHALSHVHEIVHVGVSHVEFTNGEFGIMSHVDLLVSEHSTNLKHSVETADDKFLEVQLGSDTEEEVQLEIVVVRNERLGSGTTSDHRGDGSFDLYSINFLILLRI